MNCYRVPVQLGVHHREFVIVAMDKTHAAERAEHLALGMALYPTVGDPSLIHKTLPSRHRSIRSVRLVRRAAA
jgi:hypothetical protein